MEKGNKVKLVPSYRLQFMNEDFKNYINKNSNKIFIIENIIDNSIKLYKVGFWISKDFIMPV